MSETIDLKGFGQQIDENYLSLMKAHFVNYIRDYIRSENDLKYYHKTSVEKCFEQISDTIYTQELVTKLNAEFNVFVVYCNHYKDCLKQFVAKVCDFLKYSDTYDDRGSFDRECNKLISNSMLEFNNNIINIDENNDYKIYDYDFRLILEQHIEHHVKMFESCAQYLRSAIGKYEANLHLDFRSKGWWRMIFNASNEWLECDNTVYFFTHRELDEKCAEYWHTFGACFQDKFNVETWRLLAREHRYARRTENIVTGFSLTASAVTGAGMAFVWGHPLLTIGSGIVGAGALSYLMVREMTRPKCVRNSLHGYDVINELG